MQQRNGRRGAVFSVRVTDEERAALESARRQLGGPRGLGPWLVWRALKGGQPANLEEVVPPQLGQYLSSPTQAVPELADAGSTRARRRGQYLAGGVLPPGRTVLPGPGSTRPIAERRILDLCGGSGSWSEPYRRAGYPVELVTLPADDVRTFVPPADIWGILSAPPCDQFSLARNGHQTPRDLERGLEVVAACLRIVFIARPRWWALENPVGLLCNYLGTPRDVWNPCDFGDPWTKRTAVWGDFRLPERGPFVQPLGGGPLCEVCDPSRRKTTWCSKAAHRAVTPQGFARAFFEANP